jgi:hypothetical protein
MPGINLEARASLLGESARTIVLGGKFQIAPLNLVIVLIGILDAQIGNRNLSGNNSEVIPLGYFFP